MNPEGKRLMRLACRVHQALGHPENSGFRALESCLSWTCQHLAAIEQLRQRLGVCAQRNWHLAAKRLTRDLVSRLYTLRSSLAQCDEAVDGAILPVTDVAQLYEELLLTEREFGELTLHPESGRLCVTTEAIELEGIALGPFEIQLLLDGLEGRDPYRCLRVVALAPNPPDSNEAVTHPHVSDNRLCLGDASVSLTSALRQGRIGDFFMIVRSVLETYNPGSPYVSPAQWHGRPCHDCGYVVDGDESVYCESCEHDYCDDCTGYCHGCGETLCRGCLSTCSQCGEEFCDTCLEACGECEERCCSNCLEDGMCSCCHQETENDDEELEQEEERAGAPGDGKAPEREANRSYVTTE